MKPKPPIAGFSFLFLILLTFNFLNCSNSDADFDPCTRHYELEALKPAEFSNQWIPYFKGQILQAKSNNAAPIPFQVDSFPILIHGDRSFFEIPCYEDSTKTNRVFYSSLAYQCKLVNQSKLLDLREIHISLYVLLDELESKLDKLKLADILEIDFVLMDTGISNTKRFILQCPVLDRGFANAFKSNYKFDSNLTLNGKTFLNVYSNYELADKFKVYYSDQGILGFEMPDGSFYYF